MFKGGYFFDSLPGMGHNRPIGDGRGLRVLAVVVAGGGRVVRVTFHSETAALLAIFLITNRIFPYFPGLDVVTTIDGHLKAPRVS